MEQSGDTRMRNLLQISTDLRKQMDEVRKLKKTLQRAEDERRGERRIDAGSIRTTSSASGHEVALPKAVLTQDRRSA
jgi:hypothetical protein